MVKAQVLVACSQLVAALTRTKAAESWMAAWARLESLSGSTKRQQQGLGPVGWRRRSAGQRGIEAIGLFRGQRGDKRIEGGAAAAPAAPLAVSGADRFPVASACAVVAVLGHQDGFAGLGGVDRPGDVGLGLVNVDGAHQRLQAFVQLRAQFKAAAQDGSQGSIPAVARQPFRARTGDMLQMLAQDHDIYAII
jgi:hypothetical protein